MTISWTPGTKGLKVVTSGYFCKKIKIKRGTGFHLAISSVDGQSKGILGSRITRCAFRNVLIGNVLYSCIGIIIHLVRAQTFSKN